MSKRLESDLRSAIAKIACDFEVLVGELREAKAVPPGTTLTSLMARWLP